MRKSIKAEQPETERCLKRSEVANKLGVTTHTISLWVKEGVFPVPLRLGNKPNSPLRWRESTVEKWLDGTDMGVEL